MQRIFKYKLEHDNVTLQLPMRAKILSCGEQANEIYIWVLCNPANKEEIYVFNVLPTGWEGAFIGKPIKFIRTVIMKSGLVWHVFYTNMSQNKNNDCDDGDELTPPNYHTGDKLPREIN